MASGKKLDAGDAKLHLPEAIIHRIQSFLSRKQAASTALISKLWYNSWLTLPTLDFDERDFQSDVEFMNYVTRNIERYQELNLNIENFKLWMNVSDIDSSSIATKLIVKAVKMGAKDFNLGFNPPISEYLLPKELFENKSLVGLSAVGCRIYGVKVMCSQLKSLCLCRVCIEDDMIRDILLECPLIEDLLLSDCDGYEEVNVGRMFNLKNLRVVRTVTTPSGWTIPIIEFEEPRVGSIIGHQPNVSKFGKLRYLLLERVEIDKMMFSDFSSKFPCVKDLTVRYCDGCVKFDISSDALEYISLAHAKKLVIQLDVPNVRKFKFSGASIPSLSFVTASREWESDIALSCWGNVGVSWFLKLKEFLKNLNLSKITLSIEFWKGMNVDRLPDIPDFRKPVVENLELAVYSSRLDYVALLDAICWSFRPKIITQCLFAMEVCVKSNTCGCTQPSYQQASNELVHLLCKKLMGIDNCRISTCYNSNEKMIGWYELEEVRVEMFEDIHMKWQPLTWKSLVDILVSSEKDVQIRFRLGWGQLEGAVPYHGQLI